MCMIDGSDGMVTMLGERHPVAKKEHKCNECRRVIKPGERYIVERYIWEHEPHTHKTCAHCGQVRDWLNTECGGWLFGAVAEDIAEHANEGYGFGVKLMAIGIYRKWTRKDGRLWPLPRKPKTTIDILASKA